MSAMTEAVEARSHLAPSDEDETNEDAVRATWIAVPPPESELSPLPSQEAPDNTESRAAPLPSHGRNRAQAPYRKSTAIHALENHLEQVSSSILRSISHARDELETVSPPSSSKSRRHSLFHRLRHEPSDSMQISDSGILKVLDEIGSNLDSLLLQTSADPDKVPPTISFLNRMDSDVSNLLGILRQSPERDRAAVEYAFRQLLDAISRFNSRQNSKEASPSGALPPSVAENSEMCPLEKAARAHNAVSDSRDFHKFIRWAALEFVDSITSRTVGPVHSVHLFRTHDIAFNHEFALISFGVGNAQITPSWLRVERAARWHAFRTDSFAPIISAPLRETVSFGLNKHGLAGNNVDEVASITLNVPSADDTPTGMLLHELADELKTISETYPRYRLFSANCRWFARRIVLSFGDRLNESNTGVLEGAWRMGPASYHKIHEKIQGDLFGGRQVEGQKAPLIRAEALVQLAEAHREHNKHQDALEAYQEAREILDGIQLDTAYRQGLMASCLITYSSILSDLQRYDDALIQAEAACQIMRNIRFEDSDPATFEVPFATFLANNAVAYARVGNMEQAAHVGREAVEVWRKLQKWNPDAYSSTLAASLTNLASYIHEPHGIASDLEESLSLGKEALELRKILHSRRPDLYRQEYAWALHSHAVTYVRLQQNSEALPLLHQFVSLCREMFELRPDAYRDDLSKALHEQATVADLLGLDEEAREACEESVKLRSYLFARDPTMHRLELARTMRAWARSLSRTERSGEAIDVGKNALILYRALHKANAESGAYRKAFADVLEEVGEYLDNNERSEEAEELYDEADALYQPSKSPDEERGQLETDETSLDVT